MSYLSFSWVWGDTIFFIFIRTLRLHQILATLSWKKEEKKKKVISDNYIHLNLCLWQQWGLGDGGLLGFYHDTARRHLQIYIIFLDTL